MYTFDTSVLINNLDLCLDMIKNNKLIICTEVILELDANKSKNGARKVISWIFNNINRVRVHVSDTIASGVDNDLAIILFAKSKSLTLVTADRVQFIRAIQRGCESEFVERKKPDFTLSQDILVNSTTASFYKDGIAAATTQYNHNTYGVAQTIDGGSALARYEKSTGLAYKINSTNKTFFGITPKNKEQWYACDALCDPSVSLVTMTGVAGVGKTLLALACGLQQVCEESTYKKILITRPTVSIGSDIGFLPGSMQEKMTPWLMPIYDNFSFLMRSADKRMRGKDGMSIMMEYEWIDMQPLNSIRGRSIADTFLIVDEAQNLTLHQLKAIITRASANTKIVLSGDIEQSDIKDSGLAPLIEKMLVSNIFSHIHLKKSERSELAAVAGELL